MQKANCCVHWERACDDNNFARVVIDGVRFGLCLKCFDRIKRYKGVVIEKRAVTGKASQKELRQKLKGVPF